MSESIYEFDIALSFAGEDRQTAENLANGLREFGVRVFYDRHEQATLWGKDLYQHLQTVYRDKAKYCLIFVSHHYAKKVWTKHELRQAQARAIAEEREYILPLRLDDTELPGLNSTVGYIDLRTNELTDVQDYLLRKLFGNDYADANLAELTWRGELVPFRGDEVAAFWPDKLNAAQTKRTYCLMTEVLRIPYGDEQGWPSDISNIPCHDCSAARGEYHVPGCDMEECPVCHKQIISCDCTYDKEF